MQTNAPTIAMTPCTSSQLQAYGYDPETRTLAIQFLTGVYHYYDVPPDIHRNLCDAESKGSYFIRAIRRGGFKYTKQG